MNKRSLEEDKDLGEQSPTHAYIWVVTSTQGKAATTFTHQSNVTPSPLFYQL